MPTLQQIEANAHYGAMTTSMRAAWQIAADAGLMTADECRDLVRAQFELIQRELTIRRSAADTRQTLLEMQMEYGGGPKA